MKTKAAPLLLYAKFERAADAVAALILVGKRLREFLKSKLNTISGLIIFQFSGLFGDPVSQMQNLSQDFCPTIFLKF